MRPLAVVDPQPVGGDGLQVGGGFKEVRVQHLGPVPAIEALDVRILIRLPRLDVVDGDAMRRRPVDKGLRLIAEQSTVRLSTDGGSLRSDGAEKDCEEHSLTTIGSFRHSPFHLSCLTRQAVPVDNSVLTFLYPFRRSRGFARTAPLARRIRCRRRHGRCDRPGRSPRRRFQRGRRERSFPAS